MFKGGGMGGLVQYSFSIRLGEGPGVVVILFIKLKPVMQTSLGSFFEFLSQLPPIIESPWEDWGVPGRLII